MANAPEDGKKPNWNGLLTQLGAEIDQERVSSLKPEDQLLEQISREALRLERDMTIPGSNLAVAARIDRLMKFISDKEF